EGNDMVKAAPGRLVLGNSSSDYTGRTIVQAGTLVATANNALGDPAGETVVLPGGALALQGGVNYTANETVALIGGTLRNLAGVNTFAGTIFLAADGIADVPAGSLKLTAGIRGAAKLTKTGGNTLEVKNLRVAGLAGSA